MAGRVWPATVSVPVAWCAAPPSGARPMVPSKRAVGKAGAFRKSGPVAMPLTAPSVSEAMLTSAATSPVPVASS